MSRIVRKRSLWVALLLAIASATLAPDGVSAQPSPPGDVVATDGAIPVVTAPVDARTEKVVTVRNSPSAVTDDNVLLQSAKILLRLFVLAVILESAMAVVFQWRPVVATFDPRAARPLVSFLLAAILVATLDLDIVGSLVRLYAVNPVAAALPAAPQGETILLTALVLAGGSSGVNTMLRSLGYRAIDPDLVAAKPPSTEAWIAVRWRGAKIVDVDRLDVLLRKAGDTDWSIVGTVATTGGSAFGWLLRDRRSYPPSGGFVAPLGVSTQVAVARPGSIPVVAGTWGPRVFVAGALVDVVFRDAAI